MQLLVALALAALVVPDVRAQAEPRRSDLAGVWLLDREASQTPSGGAPDPAAGLWPGSVGVRGGLGGPAAPGSGIDRRKRAAADREEIARRRALMKEVLEPPVRFQITLEDALVIFTFPDGRAVRYRADGKEERHQHQSGTVKTKTKWDAGRLLIETNMGSGPKITHAYIVSGDPRQLTVTVQIPGQSRNLPPITHTYNEQIM